MATLKFDQWDKITFRNRYVKTYYTWVQQYNPETNISIEKAVQFKSGTASRKCLTRVNCFLTSKEQITDYLQKGVVQLYCAQHIVNLWDTFRKFDDGEPFHDIIRPLILALQQLQFSKDLFVGGWPQYFPGELIMLP